MNPRYTLAIPVSLLSVLLLGGCLTIGEGVGQTPEQAAALLHPPPAGVQRIYVVKPAPKGSLVIYKRIGVARQAENDFAFGYAYVTPEWFGWTAREGGGRGGLPEAEEPAFFTNGRQPANDSTVIIGLTNDSNVSTVIAAFGNGQKIQDQVMNGLFGMMADPPKTPPCWLELLNAQGIRIKLIDFRSADAPQDVAIWTDRIQKECP